MQSEDETIRPGAVAPVAIIGIGCRFPQAHGVAAFWQLLREGRDVVGDVPPDRWDADAFYDADPQARGKMVSRYGAFIERLDLFDAQFFGISPREANHLDPRQRLALEAAWEALEDAGIAPDSIAGSDTGIFMATLRDDYDRILFEDIFQLDVYSSVGNAHSVLANRLSYVFDLHGPSVALDTACSGSLVTVHLACQSLRAGETALALAGGANVILRPDTTVVLSKAGVISPDGRCKAFDAHADGIARGEGAGIVVLKLLDRAIADGDRIYAVIRGSAVNNDGRSAGIMAPRQEAQEALLRRAYRQAGILPGCVQYIEAHGTGTRLGDPVEMNALNTVLAEGRGANQPCAIGSVKTNIGHTEAAAGIAGLIKVALALTHRMLPPSLHFTTPNPLIDFTALPMVVQQEAGPWPDQNAPLVAGVSSFGIGGTNAHVVLEAAPEPPPRTETGQEWHLFALSARTPQALCDLAAAYQTQIAAELPPLADCCATAGRGRNHFAFRRAWPVRTTSDLLEGLASVNASIPAPLRERERNLAFVFPDENAYLPGMAQQFYHTWPAFRAELDEWHSLITRQQRLSPLPALLGEAPAQPGEQLLATCVFQVALAALWRTWGVTPDALVGQGTGAIAAACVGGALTREDALLVITRASAAPSGVQNDTALVGLPLDKVQFVLMAYEDVLSISGSRSPTTSVISGDAATLDRVLISLERQGITCRRIAGAGGGQAAPIAPMLTDLRPLPARMPIYASTATGPVAHFDGTFWADHLGGNDRFGETIAATAQAGITVFLELGPAPVLADAIRESVCPHGHAMVLPLTHHADLHHTLLHTLGTLYERGWAVNWRTLAPRNARVVPLPTYPWQRERYWFDQTESVARIY